MKISMCYENKTNQKKFFAISTICCNLRPISLQHQTAGKLVIICKSKFLLCNPKLH